MHCIIFFISLILFSFSNAAEWGPRTDLRAGLNGRTYPVGAQFNGHLGIGQLLWGDADAKTETGKQEWKYGYARLAVNAATSAVVNRIGTEIQIFPVSILGFGAGYDLGVRNFTPRTVDCSNIQCNGVITRKFLRMQFLAASHGFAFSLLGRYEELRAPDAPIPFFDEVTLLPGRSSGERVLSWTPVLVYALNDRWQVGGAALYSRALDSGGHSLLYGPIAGYKPFPALSLIAGAGLNRSPVVHSGIAGFFVFQWMLKDGLAITDRIASEVPKPESNN